MIKFTALILTLLFSVCASAQDPPEGLNPTEFRAWVKANYYTGHHTALTYSNARKKMFAYASNDNDTIECFYSGLRQAHAYGLEISFPEPFNTEHIVPQSLFDGNEPMRSDMHILQPCFQDWNSLRSNFEFQELEDINETDEWIYLDQSTSSVPTQNIERYSEYRLFGWEPREKSKGDVARAFMYFFTMYPQYGEMNGWIDTSTLCQWHEEDTVDAKELFKNDTTIMFQGNINPYVAFPWWANNAYGCNVEEPPVVNGITLLQEDRLQVYPNPAAGRFNIEIYQQDGFPLIAELVSNDGRTAHTSHISASRSTLDFDVAAGSYYLILKDRSGVVLGFTSVTIVD